MSTKYLKIGSWVLFGLIAILFVHFFAAQLGHLEDGLAKISDLPSEMKAAATEELANTWTPWIMIASGILIGIAILYTVCMAIYQMAVNAISNKTSRNALLVTFVGGAVIVVISYFLADATVPYIIGLEDMPTGQTVKFIETGLFITYAVSLITIGALLYGEISKFWK